METPLTSVSGIGPAAAKVLAEHGYTSAEQLAASVIEDLVRVPGFGAARAATTLRAARSLVERAADAPSPAMASETPDKPGKEKKGRKKAKRKDKPKAKRKKTKDKGKKDKKNKKGKKKKPASGKRQKGAKPRKGGKRKKR